MDAYSRVVLEFVTFCTRRIPKREYNLIAHVLCAGFGNVILPCRRWPFVLCFPAYRGVPNFRPVFFSLFLKQDGKTLENEIEVVEGMKFDRGYISPYFVTDAKTQMSELENPIILIVEKKVNNGPFIFFKSTVPARCYYSRCLW